MQAEKDRDLGRWRGKWALVTGASSGIGEAIARRLVAGGMRVVLAARRRAPLRVLADSLNAGAPGSADMVELDVADEGSVLRAFAQLADQRLSIHVLVNNAGLGYQESLLDGVTDHWREMLMVNVLGLSLVTREGVKAMRTAGGEGHVFHLGSLAGHRILPGSNMYGATKYAVRALTESLRLELHEAGLPIRVSCLSPGFVQSAFHERYFGSAERAQALYESFEVLQPEDIADTLAFALAAPAHVQLHDVLVRATAQPR